MIDVELSFVLVAVSLVVGACERHDPAEGGGVASDIVSGESQNKTGDAEEMPAIRSIGSGKYLVERAGFPNFYEWNDRHGRRHIVAEDSGQKGIKLLAYDAGTLPYRLGLRSGDFIYEVNGGRLSTADEFRAVLSDLKTAESIRVQILRDGQRVTLEYEVVDSVSVQQNEDPIK